MDKIRDLLNRFSPQSKSVEPARVLVNDDERRSARAGQISSMQDNISRLQSEIAELSHGEAGGTGAEMTKLENELTKTQQELARIQGRV